MQANRYLIISLAFTSLLVSRSAEAWGPVAHEAVALIAERQLTEKAKQTVGQILDGKRLVDVATWADAIRQSPEWQHTKTYHFTHVPDRTSYLNYIKSESREELAKGDVVRAVLKAGSTLAARETSKADRANALAFLTHFIGDLHQPLHTGRKEDRGGNDIKMMWLERSSNLHQVWDSFIIELAFKNLLHGRPESEHSVIYANELIRTHSGRATPRTVGSLETWLMESLVVREKAYAGPVREPVRMTELAIGPINQLVYDAGLRLGAILNQIFSDRASTRFARVEPSQLEAQLARILNGDASFGVSLRPASAAQPAGFARGVKPVSRTRLSNVLSSPKAPSDKQFWLKHGCDHAH